jgi:hypothetical protein
MRFAINVNLELLSMMEFSRIGALPGELRGFY